MGGVIGIAFGMLVASMIGPVFDITALPKIDSILLAFSISVGVGVLFGFLPANKAAKLNPIDALRNE